MKTKNILFTVLSVIITFVLAIGFSLRVKKKKYSNEVQ